MGKKYVAWQIRWPATIHEKATKIAAENKRSLNAQVLFWLENGGIPAELLDECRADLVDALAGAGK